MRDDHRILPQMGDRQFLSDSGLETYLIFLEGVDLPCFASFPLLESEEGRATLQRYFNRHIDIARTHQMGFILDTPTWRASSDWGSKLGYSAIDLDRINRRAVDFAQTFRQESESPSMPIVINGVVGPRGDGYRPENMMTAGEALDYHRIQVQSLALAGADMVSAITMTHTAEAIGIALAATESGLPCIVSFTTETDGALPTGQSLAEAITETDAATDDGPAYYMVNCAHPSHFQDKLTPGSKWMKRIRGIRANASLLSHAELDNSTELDIGDIAGLGQDYAQIVRSHPQVTIFGGCCGTDHRHIAEIAAAITQSS